MTTTRFLGRAIRRAQVKSYTFGGTISAIDVYTCTINGKAITVTAGSTVAATVATTILAALQATTNPTEFTQITFDSGGSGIITATGLSSGRPFVLTITSSGSGTVSNSGAGTVTTEASSPNDWSVSGNWDSGVPATGDTAIIDLDGAEILYGLDQNAVTLAQLLISGLNCKIGLKRNSDYGYPEYLDQKLKIGATILKIGLGDGQGPSRCFIDLNNIASTVDIYKSQNGEVTGIPAVRLSNTHSSTIVDASGNAKVGLADALDETGTIATLRVGPEANVYGGIGLTVTNVSSTGTLVLNGPTDSYEQDGGDAALRGSAAHADIDVSGGQLSYESSGTASAVAVGPGLITCANDHSPRTWSATTIRAGGRIEDPRNTITHTAGIAVDDSVSSVTAA